MKTVSDILRYSNIGTTIDAYTHTTNESKIKVANFQNDLYNTVNN
jgi:hypothetical protein